LIGLFVVNLLAYNYVPRVHSKFIEDFWPLVYKALFSTAMEDESLAVTIVPWKDFVIEIVRAQLQIYQLRDDYCELLKLLALLDIQYPGCIHLTHCLPRATSRCGYFLTCKSCFLDEQSLVVVNTATSLNISSAANYAVWLLIRAIFLTLNKVTAIHGKN
jgi:hypothetical protein